MGRPRKSGERNPSGRLRAKPEGDRGTLETRAQRALRANPHLLSSLTKAGLRGTALVDALAARDQVDRRVRDDPLGILYRRDMVDGGEQYAGRRYAGLFGRAVRRVHAPSLMGVAVAGNRGVDDSADDEDGRLDYLAARRLDYLAARRALQRRGYRVTSAVDNLVVYEFFPQTPAQLAAARDGLSALKRHFDDTER
ncbi:MAG TPA: hypothetical protein VHW66_19085 [Stellaceae bacterium]|nr:hypothetical protein [Stellaceae bacterium]